MELFRLLLKAVLSSRPRQLLLCLGGVVVGVASLEVAVSVANGFEKALVDSILSTEGHVVVSNPSTNEIREVAARAERLRKMPSVRAVAPVIFGQALVCKGDAFAGVAVRGIDEAYLEASPVPGRAARFSSSNEIVVGRRLARRMGLEEGDVIRFIAPDEEERAVLLRRIYRCGDSAFEGRVVFVPLDFSRRCFGFTPSGASALLVFLRDPFRAASFAAYVSSLWPWARTETWLQANETLLKAVAMERRVMFLVLFLLLLVAGFGVSNVLVFVVYEKYGFIGMLRALGAGRRLISAAFLGVGALVGAAGAAGGSAAALALGLLLKCVALPIPGDVYYVDTLPVRFEGMDFVVVSVCAVLVTMMAALIPARKAASVEPYLALRYHN